MKNFRIYFRLLASLGLLLIIITSSLSYLEYRSSKESIMNLFKNQAETLISGVAKAGEKGLIAYQSLQEQVAQKLESIAYSVDMLGQSKVLDSALLEAIVKNNELTGIMVFDRPGRPIINYPPSNAIENDTSFVNPLIRNFSRSNDTFYVPGFTDRIYSGRVTFAVLHKNQAGKIIMISSDAVKLQQQRRAFGTGSIIEDLSQNAGVEYAGIVNGGIIIVATKNFPFEQMDNLNDSALTSEDSIRTGIRSIGNVDYNSKDVFEASAPFYVANQYYGKIVIGLNTTVLDSLNSKLKKDMVWRSILSILITFIAVLGVVLWNNFKLMSKRYDEIQKEVQKLEADKAIKARLASMGELAAGVAHEIRNPLNAIRVIIQRMQREFVPQADNNEYIELTDVVKRETDKINQSIEQFLKMARPPALNRTEGNFNECLEGVLGLFEPRANQRNIKIARELRELPKTYLDTKLCSQALLNLLENALEAIADQGNIVIKTFVKNKKIYIEIWDDGPGVPDNLKSRIFDMYFTTKNTGTGMGLPSVLMTVKEHGGKIEIIDNPEGGSIFRLEFPIV